MGGAPSGANEGLLDGVPNIGTQGTTGRRPAFLPPPDGVAEVKTEAFNMDAAAGGAGGGTIEMVTKGATNALHGALSEYNNDSALQATPFFVNAVGGAKAVNIKTQWAAAVGGPVWLPKLFNGKDKLFFFFAYEGATNNTPTPVGRAKRQRYQGAQKCVFAHTALSQPPLAMPAELLNPVGEP